MSVVPLDCLTMLDIEPDRVLKAAIGELDGVILIGVGADGELDMRSSIADDWHILWLLEKAKAKLMED